MLALYLDEPNSGNTLWSQQLSGSVNSQPVLLGSTLYAGCDDGTLYALDAATGTVQWQVDTQVADLHRPGQRGRRAVLRHRRR